MLCCVECKITSKTYNLNVTAKKRSGKLNGKLHFLRIDSL